MSSCVLAVLSLLPLGLARSPEIQGLERTGTEPAQVESPPLRLPFVFEGIVFDPHGAPAAGAVVVCSAGGRAVTEGNGRYRLEIGVPVEAHSVQITARDGVDGQLVAHRSVSLAAGSRLVQLQPLELTRGSSGQPDWLPTFGGDPGKYHDVAILVEYDDGTGPALYAGGDFTEIGGRRANGIAKYDGSRWSALGNQLQPYPGYTGVYVSAMAVFDDGTGPALFVGGTFTLPGSVASYSIAKWDGSSWTALDVGVGPQSGATKYVVALVVYDDGTGPALYAGGSFTMAGGVAADSIARWNGSSWSSVGTGISSGLTCLAVFDRGGGPELYAGGNFSLFGAVVAIAKWDGLSWGPVGGGIGNFNPPQVNELAVFDDGAGPALYAAGHFNRAGSTTVSNIAKWNGTSWSALGSGLTGVSSFFVPAVHALTVFDDGGGAALYAGGNFTIAGGMAADHIAKWDGSAWAPVATGVEERVYAFAVFDDGRGSALFAGGSIRQAGTLIAHKVIRWDGSTWSAVGTGLSPRVNALAVHDDGNGPALYAAGSFVSEGSSAVPGYGSPTNRIVRWNGTGWSALGSGIDGAAGDEEVNALAVFDDGGGTALYAGGDFFSASGTLARKIAKWDGSSWSALGSGFPVLNAEVNALAVFDDGAGTALYAAGDFSTVGGVSARRIARWDGSGWSALGDGIGMPVSTPSERVHCLAVFDDGGGPALYAGGDFTTAGGATANRIARWDGSSWSALGSGTTGPVLALAVLDDGSGPALYAGGEFTLAGGVLVNNIAKWNGSFWESLGTGVGGTTADKVFALTAFDDGSGPVLFAGGSFATAGGVAANHVARWDGSGWSPLADGVATISATLPEVRALAAFNDRTGLALHAGGDFTTASGSGDSHLAKWGCPDTTAPVIICPPSIVVDDRPGAPGEVLSYLVTAVDQEDPTPDLVCSPRSGSVFPRGTTRVFCTATDFAGNQSTCQFLVTVGAKVPHVR